MLKMSGFTAKFEWPFPRTLSEGRKAIITLKVAQFRQAHFSHRNLLYGLNLYLFAVFQEATGNWPLLRVLRSIFLSLFFIFWRNPGLSGAAPSPQKRPCKSRHFRVFRQSIIFYQYCMYSKIWKLYR